MLAGFEREFADVPGATWTVPAGGMYVWLTLDGIDTGPNGPLVAAALDAGVLYVPGQFGHVPDESGRVPTNECRICFGVATPEQITEGVKRLRVAVGAVCTKRAKLRDACGDKTTREVIGTTRQFDKPRSPSCVRFVRVRECGETFPRFCGWANADRGCERHPRSSRGGRGSGPPLDGAAGRVDSPLRRHRIAGDNSRIPSRADAFRFRELG